MNNVFYITKFVKRKFFIGPTPKIFYSPYTPRIYGRVGYFILQPLSRVGQLANPPIILVGLTQFKFVTEMENFTVHSGSWSKKGNFQGKSLFNKTVFIHESKMLSLGYAKDATPTFPFYAVADTVNIGQFALDATGSIVLDKAGKPTIKLKADGTPDTTPRFEALSVFATKPQLLQAYADEASLDAEVEYAKNDAVASIGAMASRAVFEQAI
jgi:hypothetical protein